MMEKGSEEETRGAEAIKSLEEGQQSTVQTEEEKTEVDEAVKSMEGQQSTVQTEEKTEVDEAMKSMEEGLLSTVQKTEEEKTGLLSTVQTEEEKTETDDDAMKSMEGQHSVTEPEIKKEEVEEFKAMRSVEVGQHSAQEKEEEMNLGVVIRGMEIGCSRWIADMEDILNTTGYVLSSIGKNPPSIYRVPDQTKRLNPDAYRPQLVSLGPFYYGEPDLMEMEDQKKEAVLSRVKRFGKPLLEYIASIQEVAYELLNAYQGLDDKWRRGEGRDRFVQLMVMDGCFLLELIECHFEHYSVYNPIFSSHGRLIFYSTIRSDMALLENQLPLLVLQKLLALENGKEPVEGEVNCMVLAFMGLLWPREFLVEETGIGSLCLHTLDSLHKSLCGPRLCHVPLCLWDDYTMPSAAELSNAGIHFKVTRTPILLSINFNNSVLSIPVFEAHEGTEKKLLNLMMFEKLHPGAGYEVLSFMFFMANLIKSERDVELLRSKGIVKNFLSNDKDLAKMVNRVGCEALMSPFSPLEDVHLMLSPHCKKPWNRWRATFVHMHLSNPWAIISLLAAIVVLVATLLQTVYTILPQKN